MEFYIVNADRDRKEKNTILTKLASNPKTKKSGFYSYIRVKSPCFSHFSMKSVKKVEFLKKFTKIS